MKKQRLIAVFALLCSSPAMAYHVVHEKDEFQEQESIEQVDNDAGSFSFDLIHLPKEKPIRNVIMKILYRSSSMLYIKSHEESVIFLADGENIALNPFGMVKQLYRENTEQAMLIIPLDQMRTLANAKVLKCRIYGMNYYDDAGDLSKVQQRWREFLATEVDAKAR